MSLVNTVRGLNAITPDDCSDDALLLRRTAAILSGGAAVLQLRNKTAPAHTLLELAVQLVQMCQPYAVPLIINDHINLAHACGAAGIHLGQADASVAAARSVLGAASLIGVSCYNSLERAPRRSVTGQTTWSSGPSFPALSNPMLRALQ